MMKGFGKVFQIGGRSFLYACTGRVGQLSNHTHRSSHCLCGNWTQRPLPTSTTGIIALDAWIRDDLGWRLQGNRTPIHWYDGSIRAKFWLGLIPWDISASDPPSEITSDACIPGNYAGSEVALRHKGDWGAPDVGHVFYGDRVLRTYCDLDVLMPTVLLIEQQKHPVVFRPRCTSTVKLEAWGLIKLHLVKLDFDVGGHPFHSRWVQGNYWQVSWSSDFSGG